MKREDVRKVFPDATEEQIDSILNGIGSELNPLKKALEEKSSKLDEAQAALSGSQASEAALKARLEEAEGRIQQGMSAEEILEAREKAAAEREREFTLKANGLDAKALFVEAGFSAEDIEALLPRVVSEDKDSTLAAAKALVDIDGRRRKSAEDALRDELMKGNPKPNGSSGDGKLTRAEFDAMSFSEQMKAMSENPGLLKSLS